MSELNKRYELPEIILNQSDVDEWIGTLSDEDLDLLDFRMSDTPEMFDEVLPAGFENLSDSDYTDIWWDLMTDAEKSNFFYDKDLFIEKLDSDLDTWSIVNKAVDLFVDQYEYYPMETFPYCIEEVGDNLASEREIGVFYWRQFLVCVSLDVKKLHTGLWKHILHTGNTDYFVGSTYGFDDTEYFYAVIKSRIFLTKPSDN